MQINRLESQVAIYMEVKTSPFQKAAQQIAYHH